MVKRTALIEFDPWLEPHESEIIERNEAIAIRRQKFLGDTSLDESSLGAKYFGLHSVSGGWIFREWAPNAEKIFLVGEFNDWQDLDDYALYKTKDGQWEIKIHDRHKLQHGQKYKLHIYWNGGDGYRLPSYANYALQDDESKIFDAVIWHPKEEYIWQDADFHQPLDRPIIYEAHVGMSSEEEKVASYREFADNTLPRVVKSGYNTLQLMAIAEHPYYGSFGYHVSNFFAPSSRFGTPDDLKYLVDKAHQMDMSVIMDIVHSHAVKNESEGLSRFDGTYNQYFHAGDRGDHKAWDSRVFDYGKPQVLHFLLSNCRYWIDEFHFDGFRFDGITSMLYADHGLERSFTSYDDYFGNDVDLDALTYMSMANDLIHSIKPRAITIAEDMSAMPGLAMPTKYGGMGFDYRMSMGVPDVWIKTLKEKTDEQWDLDSLFHELTTHRPEEKVISYAESHDQALVGDKTLIFRLIDKEMYFHMQTHDTNIIVERGIALHKMIRLMTSSTNGGGYLNFMGNEFGHPEWIDFPRAGNGWSHKYAKRQWNLVDNESLKYKWLAKFDKSMLGVIKAIDGDFMDYVTTNNSDHILAFNRGGHVFVFNLSPNQSFTDYGISAPAGQYKVVLSTDDYLFGGQSRINTSLTYSTQDNGMLMLYLPARTALVLKKTDTK